MDVEQKLHSLSNNIVEYIVDLGSEYIYRIVLCF